MSRCVGVREKKARGLYPSFSRPRNFPWHPMAQCVLLTERSVLVCLSSILTGWEAWKTCKHIPRFEMREERGSHVRRYEPYSPKEGFTKPRANSTVQHCDCKREQRGSHTAWPALAEEQLHKGPEAKWYPKRPMSQSTPHSELGLFPCTPLWKELSN